VNFFLSRPEIIQRLFPFFERDLILGYIEERPSILYIPKLHCRAHKSPQWFLQVMFPSACSFIVFCFPLSFTTCLHGHLQLCRIFHIFIFICLKDSSSLFFCFVAFFFTWSHSACFPFVSCSCAVFLRYFCCFLACVIVCLLFLCCLSVLCLSWSISWAIWGTVIHVIILMCVVCFRLIYSTNSSH
jgi:hypothetical protein